MGFNGRRVGHDRFYEDVRKYLKSVGYKTPASTYHDVMEDDEQELIRKSFDRTSLYVRFRADNLALPDGKWGFPFEWDAKTNINKKWGNMALEAVPLAMHKDLYNGWGVRCLYAYHDIVRDIDAGFWVGAIPPIMRAEIPTMRWTQDEIDWFQAVIRKHLSPPEIRLVDYTDGGSGTPYVLIAESHVRRLPDWRVLIDAVGEKVTTT